ncbi:MAG: AAA family ATPase, partial [Solobacterium sp.]|nr:AAA family ATPase [Solobacterium sp.]
MLKRFEVENYKGFADRLVWDFSAGDYAFNRNLVHNGLVNSALVYGRNGSGKTSLGLALFDITLHLTDKSRISGIDLQNYTNLYHPGKHVSFSYTFLFENAVVRYEYQKSGPDSLIYEKLTINNELWLDYDDSDTGTKFIHPDLKVNQNINQIDSRLSILKYIYRNTPANRIPLLTEMFRFCKNMFWYRGLSEGNPYAGFENGNASLEEAICQSGKVNEFEGFLHDHGIDHRLQFETVNGEHRLFACFPT